MVIADEIVNKVRIHSVTSRTLWPEPELDASMLVLMVLLSQP